MYDFILTCSWIRQFTRKSSLIPTMTLIANIA